MLFLKKKKGTMAYSLNKTQQKSSSTSSLMTEAKEKISRLIFLDKKLESASKKSDIAEFLIEQKKIITHLEKETNKGHAITGLALLNGMVITGMDFNRFYDYATPYLDNKGFDKILNFIKLESLIPLMKKYRTIEKADRILPFIAQLPNIRKAPFSPELYDALNEGNKKTPTSFQDMLFNRLREDYYSATEDADLVLNVLKISSLKGYSAATLLYAELMIEKTKSIPLEVLKHLKAISHNKFASLSDREKALLILKPITQKNNKKRRRITKESQTITY